MAAGAVDTPAILLRSINDSHPRGLANGSDQVGRNLMKAQLTSILQLAAAQQQPMLPTLLASMTTTGAIRTSAFPLEHPELRRCFAGRPVAESPPVLSLVSRG